MIKKSIVTLCALFVFGLYANAVKVVFRLDDPTVQYDSTHFRVLQLFNQKKVPLSIAMVPCTIDESPYKVTDSIYWAYLCAPDVEITLHGLTHEDINGKGEFGGLSYEETNRRFQKGKEILEKYFQKPIITFIPPFNATNSSFSENLENNHLHILSADLFQEIPCKSNIQYFPETLGHLMKQKGIWNAAKQSISSCNGRHTVCVIMFHAYDLADSTAWIQLEDLLDYCISNEKVELYTFSSLQECGETSNWLRYRANQLSSGLGKIVLTSGVLHPTWICLAIHATNALLYAIISVLGLFVMLVRSRSQKEKKYLLLSVIFVGALVVCLAWFHYLSPLKLLLLAVLVNVLPFAYLCMHLKRLDK